MISLPTRDLAPGVYRLVIEAQPVDGRVGKEIVRETRFRVHPQPVAPQLPAPSSSSRR